MYIAVFKNNGKDYLRLMESYRTKTDEGKIAIRKRIICNIGPLSKYDDGKPDTGEVIASSRLKALLDKEKLEEFKSHFGYYQIVTSEINMPVTEVIEKYHGLTRIEDQFEADADLSSAPASLLCSSVSFIS